MQFADGAIPENCPGGSPSSSSSWSYFPAGAVSAPAHDQFWRSGIQDRGPRSPPT